MAVVINAKGTSVAQFQIGKQGPIIKNNSGIIEFKDSTDTDLQVQILSTSNAVNNLTLTGSITGGDATIAVVGTDTNINIKIEPKGTGEVILGPTGAASSSLQAEDDQDLFVLGGDSAAAAAGDLVLQGGDGTGGFASGNVEIRGGTGGSGSGTVIIDSTEFALPSGGGITIGSATGGNQGSGSINVVSLFINGTQLTTPQTTFDSDTFTGTGSQTAFTMSRTPIGVDAILVAVSGLVQDGGVDYTVSGTTLTFTTAPPNTAKILVLFRDIFTTGTLTRDNFTGDGSTTGFTLTEDPGVAANLLVFIDGVTQYTPDAYTVSGTTLTFTSAPANTADIQTVQLNTGLASIVPGDSSVSFAKLDSSLQANYGSNKNVIINGNFDIWQRGTSFTAPVSTDYTTDRFLWGFGGTGVVDILQSTSVPDNTSEFSLQIDVTTADASIAAGDNYGIQTRIEGYDIERFGFGSSDATSLTLSFWVLSSKTGIHCISLKNNDSTRTFIIEYTVNVADTWEFKTTTLTADTTGTWLVDNGIGLKIIFGLAIGSTFHTTAGSWTAGNFLGSSNQVNVMDSAANNFHLSRVQLELGSTATNFERRSFAQELATAQRYYWTTLAQIQSTQSGSASFEKSTSMLIYPQEMRTTPSVTLVADGTRTNLRAGSSGLTVTGTTSSGASLFIESSPPASGSTFAITDETITFDAEL